MMEKNYIYNKLIERGYDDKSACLIIPDLMQLHNPLDKYLELWIQDKTQESDYILNNYSVKQLMKERNMTYPAALLTMDWLIKEPNQAIKSLKRGIK